MVVSHQEQGETMNPDPNPNIYPCEDLIRMRTSERYTLVPVS